MGGGDLQSGRLKPTCWCAPVTVNWVGRAGDDFTQCHPGGRVKGAYNVSHPTRPLCAQHWTPT